MESKKSFFKDKKNIAIIILSVLFVMACTINQPAKSNVNNAISNEANLENQIVEMNNIVSQNQ